MSFSAASRCFEAEAAATSTHFMELRAIAAWKPRRALLVPTNVCFAGGKILQLQFCFGGRSPSHVLQSFCAIALGERNPVL